MKNYILSLVLSCCWIIQHGIGKEISLTNTYLGSRESDPASLVQNVSTIYGDYTEVEVDPMDTCKLRPSGWG